MPDRVRPGRRWVLTWTGYALALIAGGPGPAAAQTGATVQAVPPAQAVERLNSYLTRLSRAPTDLDALLGAGRAAYDLGDAQAANGFFTRAEMVDPRSGQAKIGLALVELSLRQPVQAARHFDEASALGVGAGEYLPEKGLAYDLVGKQEQAQRDYAIALRVRPNDEALIRSYAISLGVSGRLSEAEAMLRPLLTQSNRAAWRDRTMILAMNGHVNEARRIAQSTMPPGMADAMDPYLARMGALTPAQKALAAHYGQFPADGLKLAPVLSPPAAVQVATQQAKMRKRKGKSKEKEKDDRGRAAAPASSPAARSDSDDPVLLAAMPRAVAKPAPPVPSAAAAGGRRTDGSDDDPDGWTATERRVAEQRIAQRPQSGPAALEEARARTRDRTAPAQVPASDWAAARTALTAPTKSPPAASSVPGAPAPLPTDTLPAAAPRLAPPAPQPPERSLADIMADIEIPDTERQSSTVPVDLAQVARLQAAQAKAAAAERAKQEAAAKAKAEAQAKAKAEAEKKALIKANPARIWLQVATGRDTGALAFDLRRLKRTYDALADQSGFTAEWGQTRRLLVGPFATLAKAKAIESDLKKAGGDAFVWQSEAGEVVTSLSKK